MANNAQAHSNDCHAHLATPPAGRPTFVLNPRNETISAFAMLRGSLSSLQHKYTKAHSFVYIQRAYMLLPTPSPLSPQTPSNTMPPATPAPAPCAPFLGHRLHWVCVNQDVYRATRLEQGQKCDAGCDLHGEGIVRMVCVCVCVCVCVWWWGGPGQGTRVRVAESRTHSTAVVRSESILLRPDAPPQKATTAGIE